MRTMIPADRVNGVFDMIHQGDKVTVTHHAQARIALQAHRIKQDPVAWFKTIATGSCYTTLRPHSNSVR